MPRRKYSDREKAEALATYDACGSLTETARITGIPDSTLSAWVNGTNGLNDDIPDLRNFKKLDLASKLDQIAHQCAGLLPERLPEANVREIVGAMGQSIEKSQLLRGKPTEITSSADSLASSIEAKITQIALNLSIPQENAAIQFFSSLSDFGSDHAKPENFGKFRPIIENYLSKSAESQEIQTFSDQEQ